VRKIRRNYNSRIIRLSVEQAQDHQQPNKDDQVGLAYQSFNKPEHYPHGERKRDDVPDLSNNVLIDYSIFGTKY